MGSFRDVSSAEIARLVRDMDDQGYGCLASVFPEETIAEARRFVLNELERHGGSYFSYIGREPVRGSLLADLGASANFRDVLARIYERGTGKPGPDTGLFQVLRVLAGKTGVKQSYRFHYDAYVVTALVPIAIPGGAGEQRGDLIIYPKLRSIRRNVLVNVAEKVVLQSPLGRRLARSPLMRRMLGAKLLRMVPGHVYFFWGYQSLHGNEPCHASSVRSTALFHYADPHENNVVVAAIQALRRRHEQRVRERALARTAHRAS